ncbi:MAG TPA: GNAT family N-acetyltransferase [Polyangiales bacterium]|nr:GNAT family N-acetyltransferase [Polyangiales bacterium]
MDVERLERAVVAGVAPLDSEELPGWLLPLDRGEVNRAISAVPLHHGPIDSSLVPAIVERYRAHGLQAQFRLADVPGLAALQAELAAAGFTATLPTFMQLAETARIQEPEAGPDVTLTAAADADWNSVFHSVAFTHGAATERAARLARVPSSLYATLRVDAAPVAVGALTFADGLASLHSMRTAESHRCRRHGRTLVLALAQAARARGVQQLFLQVEAAASPARALYDKLGFSTLWRYRYWKRPA